jgi:hypothetical protein
LVARSLGVHSAFYGKLNKQAVWAPGGELQHFKNKESVFCIIVFRAFLLLVFKGKIRPRGTKSETAVVIANWGHWGHKKIQATCASSGDRRR